jgi:hypothetical protein
MYEGMLDQYEEDRSAKIELDAHEILTSDAFRQTPRGLPSTSTRLHQAQSDKGASSTNGFACCLVPAARLGCQPPAARCGLQGGDASPVLACPPDDQSSDAGSGLCAACVAALLGGLRRQGIEGAGGGCQVVRRRGAGPNRVRWGGEVAVWHGVQVVRRPEDQAREQRMGIGEGEAGGVVRAARAWAWESGKPLQTFNLSRSIRNRCAVSC